MTGPFGGIGTNEAGKPKKNAIAHTEADRLILNLLREVQPPMSPEAVTGEFADDLRRYGLRKVTADRWGAGRVEERFRLEGIAAGQSADPKSTIYGNFLPLLNSGRVRLLDNARLVSQLVGLERRTARGGRDTIDHGPGGHDDVVNAAAAVLCGACEVEQGVLGNVSGLVLKGREMPPLVDGMLLPRAESGSLVAAIVVQTATGLELHAFDGATMADRAHIARIRLAQRFRITSDRTFRGGTNRNRV